MFRQNGVRVRGGRGFAQAALGIANGLKFPPRAATLQYGAGFHAGVFRGKLQYKFEQAGGQAEGAFAQIPGRPRFVAKDGQNVMRLKRAPNMRL